ncbi:MAG: glycosyltransferase family 4 protein [Chlamydiae bacterium]|nr:glycosyltransferase family 4 protein [Chlamydiota bacterium]HQM51873.1 glycosyltransferase family 4 protein [bacterium]
MKILMLAPEPFFSVRGTPFSIRNRVRVLSELGHEVDLVTYHLGEDIAFPGLTIRRIPALPFIRHVRVGPSPAKLPLDLLLFWTAAACCARTRYDCVHTHEEAAAMGVALRVLLGIPHIYDMHSSLPEQLRNYNYPRLLPGLCARAARLFERCVLRHSDAVIAICPHLKEIALAAGARGRVDVVDNLPLGPDSCETDPADAARLRAELGPEGAVIALYTGTFEYNQGLEAIVRGIPRVAAACPDVVFVFVGGEPPQIEAIRALGERLGVGKRLILPGRKPPEEMPRWMAACDILLSYRQIGTNTPLKLYSYLRSGKPTVATDLLVHTQVLDRETAMLTEPTVEAFADGVAALARDPGLRNRLGANARRLAERRYSYRAHFERVRDLYAHVQALARAGSA